MTGKIDYRVYKFCQKLYKKNKITDQFFVFGAVKSIYILGLVAAIVSYSAGITEILGVILRVIMGLGISALIGLYVRRKRPTKAHLGSPLIKLMPFEYWKSFPSDHALLSTIFLLAALPFLSLPWAGAIIIVWCWVLLSRVYVGVHYLSDVGFGALLGLIVQLMMGTIG